MKSEVPMAAIITGSSGFIGRHLQQRIDKLEYKSIGFDKVDPVASVSHHILGDITDPETLRRAMTDCSMAFHQAAFVSVPMSVDDPASCFAINATGTLNVLLAAKDAGVSRVIVASSSAIYGNDPSVPKVETLLPDPISPYASSKVAAEYLCSSFAKSYDMQTVMLRYFNVYGPGQSGTSEYAAVIPRFIDALIRGEAPVIFGDGNQTRDFVYIDDVVQANVCAAEAPDVAGEVFNIGSGTQVSLNDLLEIIVDILGVAPRAEYRPERAGDVRHSVADTSKAQSMLGYKPRTSLEDGLRHTIDWYLRSQDS